MDVSSSSGGGGGVAAGADPAEIDTGNPDHYDWQEDSDDNLVPDADPVRVAAAVAAGHVDRAFLENAPGCIMLSQKEQDLCVKIKLLPK